MGDVTVDGMTLARFGCTNSRSGKEDRLYLETSKVNNDGIPESVEAGTKVGDDVVRGEGGVNVESEVCNDTIGASVRASAE